MSKTPSEINRRHFIGASAVPRYPNYSSFNGAQYPSRPNNKNQLTRFGE